MSDLKMSGVNSSEIRKVAQCVYLACDESIAADIAVKCKRIADAYDSNQELIAKLQDELVSCANTIDSLVKSGHISHHPQVELDAMTDGMRSVAATAKG